MYCRQDSFLRLSAMWAEPLVRSRRSLTEAGRLCMKYTLIAHQRNLDMVGLLKNGATGVSKPSTSSQFADLLGGIRAELTRLFVCWRQWQWMCAVTAVLATGTLLRLCQLNLKPLHHDEGVNGFFLLSLFRQGIYRYNAANYHGPTLYYFAMMSCSVNNLLFGGEGPSTVAIRMVPALFGIGALVLLMNFRSRLGNAGTLVAIAMAALSPGMVYVSRDFIHEMLLVFFTLWLVVCGLHFWDTKMTRYLLLASVAAALMICTKETAPISLVALGVSAGCAIASTSTPQKMTAAEWGGWWRIGLLALAAVVLFLASSLLFYSSFFGNYPQGIRDAVTTYTYWARTGLSQHTAPWYTYLAWLLREEAPIFLLGAIGAALALFRRRNRLAIFAAVWALALLAAYSILPYKTPWILLNMILPLCLVAGHAAQELWDARMRLLRGRAAWFASASLIALALAIGFYQSVQLNFFHYDDGRYSYPYAQTHRGFLDLVAQINTIASSAGGENAASITVVTSEYWPLPWYLRDYRNVTYHDHVVPASTTMFIGSWKEIAGLQRQLAERYRLVGAYPLRPGVDLVLYATSNQSH
jgi:uncharacterized protein (TIGR03663 family)